MDGKLIEAGIRRLDKAVLLAHAHLGQLSQNREDRVRLVIGAKVGHVGKLMHQ